MRTCWRSTPTIRRAEEDAHVRVNGVLLGAEPTPLMHGDKVEIAGLELRYADDAKGGATQFVSSSDIASLAGAKRAGVARATAASGGRLVSLVDLADEFPLLATLVERRSGGQRSLPMGRGPGTLQSELTRASQAAGAQA